MEKSTIAKILFVLITLLIFTYSLLSFTSVQCKCGGCCEGCPGDCSVNLGFPAVYYYSGINNVMPERQSGFNLTNLLIDLVIWAILILTIYKFLYKK